MITATKAMMSSPEIEAIEKQIEELKKQRNEARSKLAPEPVNDYTLTRPDGSKVKLSELFAGKRDLVVIHNMGRRCVYCTLWADGLTGFAPHIMNRAGFALSSPDSPDVLKEFSESRGWNFPCVSTEGTEFTSDMGFEPRSGEYWPGMSAFHLQDDGTIVRTGSAIFGPGDDYCSIWPMMDLLHEGPAGWEPKYKY